MFENLFLDQQFEDEGDFLPLIAIDEEGEVKAFVGLIWNDSIAVPESFDIKEIAMKGLVRAELKGHAFVVPNPNKVINKIRKFAESKDLTLNNIVIDRYPEESIIYTEIPVKSGLINVE